MSLFYAPKIKHVSANLIGRDFITGDIHGGYDSIIKALRKVKFDKKKDRLFCVGDLIDRGPQSYRVRKFLEQDYVYAVRGNHEDMLLDLYENGHPDEDVVRFFSTRNGFDWWMNVDRSERKAIVQAIRKLPLVMEVDTPRGPFGVLHADIATNVSWDQFKKLIENEDKDAVQTALWGRSRLRYDYDKPVPGIGRIFVGHTVQWDGLKVLGNIYGIDTGTIFAEMTQEQGVDKIKGRLTFVNACMATQILRNPPKEGTEDIRDGETPEQPFGISLR